MEAWENLYGLQKGRYTVALMDLERWMPCIVKDYDGDPQGNGEIILVMDKQEVPTEENLIKILSGLWLMDIK